MYNADEKRTKEVRAMPPSPLPADSSGFVSIAREIPEVLLDIRYYSAYNFVGDRIDGYQAPAALLTREAAAALQTVSRKAQDMGYVLKVFDAYRPQSAIQHFMRWAENLSDERMKPIFYPNVEKKDLFRLGYISERSNHSRGSTVDLTLFDRRLGRDVDMGGPFDFFGELSHPEYRGITETQYQNRMPLRSLMKEAGFRPISSEWWHFTRADEPYPETYFTFPVVLL